MPMISSVSQLARTVVFCILSFLRAIANSVLECYGIQPDWCPTNAWLFVVGLSLQYRLYLVSIPLASPKLTKEDKAPYYVEYNRLWAASIIVGAVMGLLKQRTENAEPGEASPAGGCFGERTKTILFISQLVLWIGLIVFIATGAYNKF